MIDQTSLIYCAGVQSAPPGFLRMAGHPLRWRLLTELAAIAVVARGCWASPRGSRPKPLHPEAVRVMREHGIDISGRRSRHLEEFAGQRFGYVITLCNRVARSARSSLAIRS